MQVIRRKRLGNNTEDITYFPGQVKGGVVAITDGYDVLGAPLSTATPPPLAGQRTSSGPQATQLAASPVARPVSKLFDVLKLDIKAAPRGITFVEPQGIFVFNDTAQTTRIFTTDQQGAPLKPIDVQYPNDDPPVAVEGLSYIPAGNSDFPDHLVRVTTILNATGNPEARLEIINFSGDIVRRIVPSKLVVNVFLTGISFRSPGSLLVSSDDDETIYELDFNGDVIATYGGPKTSPRPQPQLLHGIEGLAETPDSKVAAASALDGFLVIENLGDAQTASVDYRIGIGLSIPTALTWDSVTNQFLLRSLDRRQPGGQFVSSLAPALTTSQTLFPVDPLTRKITFLPDEQLIAATHTNNPRGILLFNRQGQPAGQIDTSQFGTPLVINYIPTTREFVVVFRGQSSSTTRKLFILTRAGALSRTLDLGAGGITQIAAVAFFKPLPADGGQFLVIDGPTNTGVISDFSGMKFMRAFSIRDTFSLLNATDVAAITSGSDAGAFGILNRETSEVVVFRLN